VTLIPQKQKTASLVIKDTVLYCVLGKDFTNRLSL